MNILAYTLSFCGHELLLTNQRVIYWPAERTLVLSDMHLGKAAHFRKHGIPLPTAVNKRDVSRLQQLLDYYIPEQVVIVGDLIHAGANKEVESFKEITQKYAHVRFLLVKGNHDIQSQAFLKQLGITPYPHSLQVGNIHFTHLPQRLDGPTISGHIHPGVSVKLPPGKYHRFPCYAVTEDMLILPAFSLFTGLDTRTMAPGTVYYAFHGGGFLVMD